MREECEVHRLLKREEGDVVLDLSHPSSDEEPRVFLQLCINSLAGEVCRLMEIRNIVVTCTFLCVLKNTFK